MSEIENRLRDAQEAVATMQPPTDLWDRVAERATRSDATLLDITSTRRRPAMRWLAAAAVVVLALISGWLVLDGDQTVDTGPVTPDTEENEDSSDTTVAPAPVAPAPATLVSGVGCPFGLTGDLVQMETGPVDPVSPRFTAEPGQGIAHAVVGDQVAEIRVPGFIQSEGGDWRKEGVTLERGLATVWLDGPASGERGLPFVQVTFPGGAGPCNSFSVTVDGGTEAENRRTAEDLADRIVLPGEDPALELPGAEGGPVAGMDLPRRTWEVFATSSGYPSDAVVTFTDTTVTWNTGCAEATATYVLDRRAGVLTLTDATSTAPGCTPPTLDPQSSNPWEAIAAVLGSQPITVTYTLEFPGGNPDDGAIPVVKLADQAGSFLLLVPA
jgi:hypothetical protein